MNTLRTILFALLALAPAGASAGLILDEKVLGELLGGWTEKSEQAASYTISGSQYRTWKPHVTPTLDGGIYLSVRVDHLRGRFASDDHASLELTYTADGEIATARSTIALQGRKITSDLIRGGSQAGTALIGVDRAVKVGTDLVADLSSKLLREKISEPGRVGFPAALRHNYNLVTLSIRKTEDAAEPVLDEAGIPQAVPVAPPEERPSGDAPKPEQKSEPETPAQPRQPTLEVSETDPNQKKGEMISEDL